MTIKVYWHSNEDMYEVESGSVQLVLTGPDFPRSFSSEEVETYYKDFKNLLFQCHEKLKKRGFLVVEVTDNYRGGSLKLRHIKFCEIIKNIGFNIFNIKIWNRDEGYSATRPGFSYLIFACKDNRLPKENYERMKQAPFSDDVWTLPMNAITRYLWKEYSAFPDELAKRVIETFTNKGDKVLDPYMGTCTTVLVAEKLKRIGIGYEINEKELRPVYESRKINLGVNQKSLEDW